MTEVQERRRSFEAARVTQRAVVDRERALLGRSMIRAREQGAESQTTIGQKLGIGAQQVRDYERAYRNWLRDHPGESLD